MAPEIPERIVAIGAGENIPGLRRVITDLNEFRSLDAAYIAQQERLMPEPARWGEWLLQELVHADQGARPPHVGRT